MNLKNQIRPYYVCGGFPKDDCWIFFTPSGEIKITGCNQMLEVLLPLCNGTNWADAILTGMGEIHKRKDVEEMLVALFRYLILVDANRISQVFYAYSKNPMPFFTPISQEETFNFVSDQGHIPLITGHCFEAQFKKTALQKMMDRRCSTRDFSGEALSEEMIFSIIWSAYGMQVKRNESESNFFERTFTVPSGGALYPLLVYLLLFKKCDSLEKGIYLWHKEKNVLELVNGGDFLIESEKIIIGIPSLKDVVGAICVVADFERSATKYGNKAYNLIQQEVGHVMQNVALFCAEQDIGNVEIGGYQDDELACLLGLRFPAQAPLVVSAFGKKRRKS